jgi:hypothetical protein
VELFERLLLVGNDLGLLSEEYGASTLVHQPQPILHREETR